MELNENETLDDLENGYSLLQRRDGFRFGIDAVLLSDFAKCNVGRLIDLCTGTGIVAVLLAAKTEIPHIDAVEIQKEIADMAARSVRYNKLEERVRIRCADLKDAPDIYGKSVFDAVTVNPPYMKSGAGLVNDADIKLISRHEVCCMLEDVMRVSADLLKTRGRLFMVHRPQRLADLIYLMRVYKIEPKRMRLVAPMEGKAANLVLIEGIKNAGSELRLMPTLYVYEKNGAYTKEIDTIYGR
ncbi:MAG: tRNA1(Val) (adenine(37)-N6)-methyltransferase [Clostridia bacterium]|nr:tRNA1(Val) (adenine(37)-N6)-methyltransferase [Clostridia bacterium]